METYTYNTNDRLAHITSIICSEHSTVHGDDGSW